MVFEDASHGPCSNVFGDSEEDQETLNLIYLDHSQDLSPYISKYTSELLLVSAAIRSPDPSLPID